MSASIDVVIITWNDGSLLHTAIESVLCSDGVDVKIYVVDNGSAPPASVPDDHRIHLIRSDENLGVSKGRNVGVRAGDGSFVCLLDSDAALHPETLAGLRDALIESDDIGLVGPVFAGQEPEESGGAAPTLSRKVARVFGRTSSYESTRQPDQARWDVDFVIGACQLFRRRAYDDVGGIDERWFYGPEDADFCMRMRNAGWSVRQCGDVVCDHPPRRRNRKLLTRRGIAHAKAVAEFLWRHRSYRGVDG
jgi:hypothetical protein